MSKNERTFMDLCIAGETNLEGIGLYVEKWHKGEDNRLLHDYLGMSLNEYALWMVRPKCLRDIVFSYKIRKISSKLLKITAQVVSSHVSKSKISSEELVNEIKTVFYTLALMDNGLLMSEVLVAPAKETEMEIVKKPSIPLDEIVKRKYVVCLECGKKLRTLKAHLRKAHHIAPAEYYQRYGLDPKQFPLVCREYSEGSQLRTRKKSIGDHSRAKSVA